MTRSIMNKFPNKYLFLFFFTSIFYGQTLGVGDTIPSGLGLPWCANNSTSSDSLFLDDYNYQVNDHGSYSIIVFMTFTSW